MLIPRMIRTATRTRFALAAISWTVLLLSSLHGQNLPPSKPGFPAVLPGGKSSHGQPVVADLGLTPGHKSVVFGTSGRKLYVVLYNGSVAPGFPVTLPGDVLSSPAIGDINNDGVPEIVVGYGSNLELAATGSTSGGVRAISRTGATIWDRPSQNAFTADGMPDAVESTPAIGDIDGDGLNDVAWGSVDGNVYVVRGADGVDKPGFPHFVRDTITSSPALTDLDGDGKLDVIIGVDAHLEGPPYNTPDGGCIHAFRAGGIEVAGFPKCFDQVINSAPSVGDIDGDGRPEIVFGTGVYWPNRQHKVYALKCDGSTVPGWPVSVDGQVSTSPALADLDGDGVLDVVVTDDDSGPSRTFHVYAFKGNGALLWSRVPKDYFGNTLSAGQPVVADILGDSKPEVIVPTNTELCVFSSTGTQLTDAGPPHTGSLPSFFAPTSVSGAAVADFENDGVAIEVVALSATPFPTADNTSVYVWNPKAPSAPNPTPWGMFRRSADREGSVLTPQACVVAPEFFYTVTPCRVVDTRLAAGPLGGPGMVAMTTRDFPIAGNCGIPVSAKAAVLNVTVTASSSYGDVRLFPSGGAASASTLNWNAGRTRANNAVIPFGTGGNITVWCVMPSGATHVLIDVAGYFQ